MKKLYKDKSTGYILGVLSGIAQYLKIDATIVRIAYVAISLIFMKAILGIILYIILALIMPEKEDIGYSDYKVE